MSHFQSQSVNRAKNRPAMLAAGIGLAALMLMPGLHGYWQGLRVENVISPQKDEVDLAETTVVQLQANQKKVMEEVGILDSALALQMERMRWPILLEELAKKSQPGMWLTKIALLPLAAPDAVVAKDQTPAGKPRAAAPAVPQVELSGIFETKSEEADAQVVEQFRKSLEEGGVLQKIVTVERETPERSGDGTTEQVALKFTLRGEWPDRTKPLSIQSDKRRAQ